MATTSADRSQRVPKFRDLMKQEGIDAFIVPTDDPHMSEYTAPYFGRREYISGFTGSAGTVVITSDESLLFTDGRYHNQAELELKANQGENWVLMKQGLKDVPTPREFLSKKLENGSVVGIDPLLHPATELKRMKEAFSSKGISIKSILNNPVDKVWGSERPTAPSGLIRVHKLEYAGKSVQEKLLELREKMSGKGASALVSTSLDEIAYLFNIRGTDVPCNPVAVAYALITDGKLIA